MNAAEFKEFIKSSDLYLSSINQMQTNEAKEFLSAVESKIKSFNEGGNELLKDGETLNIGIVGQVKAGKSSFLNSLFFEGESILPKASTPMTAGLTVIEYSDTNTFEIEYFSREDWDIFVKQDQQYRQKVAEIDANMKDAPASVKRSELKKRTSEEERSSHEMIDACTSNAKSKIGASTDVRPFANINDLQNILEQYVGATGEYTSVVKSLYIKLNDERLKGYCIVDTPGVNDPVVSREERTKNFLKKCHCVMLLSSSSDFLGKGDVEFLNTRVCSTGINCVLVLASKFDSVLQDRGGEAEMKGKGREDLVEIAEDQKRKFQRRFEQIRDSITNQDLNARVDYTAGIGYSIAHKSNWDDVEKNVVAQMQRFYPEYFSTPEDIKETFHQLSNVDDIREKYLEKWFIKEKESIISNKVNDYLIKAIDPIKESVLEQKSILDKQLAELQKATIEKIKEQAEANKKMFANLGKTLDTCVGGFKPSLQSSITSIRNNAYLKFPTDIPTNNISRNITVKGDWWGHNNDDFYVKQIDFDSLTPKIERAIEEYCRDINSKWRELFKQTKRDMSDKLTEAIYKAAGEIMSSAFDKDFLCNQIDRTLNELRSFDEIDIHSLINKVSSRIRSLENKQYRPSTSYELTHSQAASKMDDEFDASKSAVRRSMDAIKDSVVSEMRNLLDASMRNAIAVVERLNGNFTPQLEKNCDEYLKELEKKLKDKEKAEDELKALIAQVDALCNLFK